jgi:hypothetical protein
LSVGVFVRKDPEAAVRGTISGPISCGDVCEVTRVSPRKRKFHYLLASSAIVSVTWRCGIGHTAAVNGRESQKTASGPGWVSGTGRWTLSKSSRNVSDPF